MKIFNDNDFESLKKEPLVAIQFSASWCSPCQALKPVLERLSNSDEYKEKISFFYADVENEAINVASSSGIRGVPTTILYSFGNEIERVVGFPGEAKIKEVLNKCLNL